MCLQCGMSIKFHVNICPKCDNNLERQTDGSTLTVDIAHKGERVHEALEKMEDAIAIAKSGTTQFLNLIVGGGVIREDVLQTLVKVERLGEIESFEQDNQNAGIVIIKLK